MKIPLYTEDLIKALPKMFPAHNLLKGSKPNFEVSLQEIWFEQGKQYVLQRLAEAQKIQHKESSHEED